MNLVSEVMKRHEEFCNIETRAPELLYIFKKYNYDDVVIVDLDHHPIGIVNKETVSDEALKDILHPFNLKAEKLMSSVKMTLGMELSIDESLKIMEKNNLNIAPVVDNHGQCLGVVKKEDLIKQSIH
jgi:predicted transcriptional regulator